MKSKRLVNKVNSKEKKISGTNKDTHKNYGELISIDLSFSKILMLRFWPRSTKILE